VKSSVVIVNWNSGERLRRCLESLPKGILIVVVDNASTDGSVQHARECSVSATFIQNDTNLGFAAAVNQGVSVISTDFVLLLNPDVLAEQVSIGILEDILKSKPRAGAIGGFVNEKYLPRPLATPWTIVRENLGVPTRGLNQGVVGQAAAAAMLIRREAFLAVGGFDERFQPAWYEDVDFCRRLHDGGWTVHFSKEASFPHEGGYSARAMGRSQFAQAYYRNQLRYVQKHFSPPAAAIVRASIALGMAARVIASPSQVRALSGVIAGALWQW